MAQFLTTFYNSFENGNAEPNIISIPFNNAKFGILSLSVASCSVTVQEQEFIFVIDRSGSMSDRCSDGRTKMQHISHTLKNMILYFHENPTINLHISVFAFDDKFVSVVERTRIYVSNLQEILTKIDRIRPSGSTDIELALEKTGDYIEEIKKDYPQHIISHIFMTDGEATTGSTDHNILKGLINPHIENAFIGFGINHDSTLLNHLSFYNKSSYYFIDALEKAGLVYGEILHGILYKYLTDVEICVKNGLIYDYKDNQWVNKLFVGDIAGEANKTYHLISNTPDTCKIILNCKNSGEEYSFQASQLMNPDSNHKNYIYRQKTLELLYQVRQLQKNRDEVKKIHELNFSVFTKNKDNTDYIEYTTKMKNLNNEKTELKQRLRAFFEEIKKYMLDNNLNEDKFLKNLCDDIYITYRTFGTKYGDMYTSARQTSQGAQRCYTVSNTPEEQEETQEEETQQEETQQEDPYYRFSPISSNSSNNSNNSNSSIIGLTLLRPQRSFRQTNTPNLFGGFINDTDIQHNLSSFDEAPYLTPTAARVMRNVSYGISEE
jgi:uncharacterized protein YegL